MSEEKVKINIWHGNWIPAFLTAMIGYHIHHSIGWSILDYIFWPFAWMKWLLLQQVNWSIIHDTFSFFWK